MPAIRANIRQLRDERGMTQEDLADKAGIDVRTVQRIERGATAAHATARDLAGALGVDIATLLRPERPADTKLPSQMADETPRSESSELDIHLDALAIHEVRRIRECLKARWPTAKSVSRLLRFADRYSFRVREEVLQAIAPLVGSTRCGTPLETLRACSSVITAAIPLQLHRDSDGGSAPRTRCYASEQLSATTSFTTAEGTSRTSTSSKWVAMFSTPSCDKHESGETLRNFVHDLFENACDAARHKSFEDAVRWLTFEEEDALALNGKTLPVLPWDLFNKLHPPVPALEIGVKSQRKAKASPRRPKRRPR